MTQIEQIKAEIERIDRECQGKQYYIPARQKLDELRTFIDSMEKDEAQIPKLPDNVDEAAEKYGRDTFINECMENGACDDHDLSDAFKAGAKWMTGQFQKIDGDLVDWYSTSDGKNYCCGVKTIEPHEVPEGFYIRKKKEKEDDRRNT